jgi:hypothetical protein
MFLLVCLIPIKVETLKVPYMRDLQKVLRPQRCSKCSKRSVVYMLVSNQAF